MITTVTIPAQDAHPAGPTRLRVQCPRARILQGCAGETAPTRRAAVRAVLNTSSTVCRRRHTVVYRTPRPGAARSGSPPPGSLSRAGATPSIRWPWGDGPGTFGLGLGCCDGPTSSSTPRTASPSSPPRHPRAVVVLVHHIHREQWPVAGGSWLGSAVDRVVAGAAGPRAVAVRRCLPSAEELAELGWIRRIAVRNGLDPLPEGPGGCRRDQRPTRRPRAWSCCRDWSTQEVEDAIDAGRARAASRARAGRDRQRLVGRQAARLRGRARTSWAARRA